MFLVVNSNKRAQLTEYWVTFRQADSRFIASQGLFNRPIAPPFTKQRWRGTVSGILEETVVTIVGSIDEKSLVYS